MYGLVNRSIEDLIVSRFGDSTWEKIRLASGVEEEVFLSNESYPDSVTYQLVGAASQVLGMPAAQILEAFGEHWVLKTARESYGAMLDLCGRNLPDFLRNLPNLHSRVILLFPKLQPPRFTVSDATPTSLVLHHQTHREGLAPFTVGLIKGLGKHFNTPVTVTQVGARGPGCDRDSFRIEWTPPHPTAA
jgi:Haem-NO-binding